MTTKLEGEPEGFQKGVLQSFMVRSVKGWSGCESYQIRSDIILVIHYIDCILFMQRSSMAACVNKILTLMHWETLSTRYPGLKKNILQLFTLW